MIALLQLGDDGVEAAGEEAEVEHPAVRQAVEQLVQPLQDDRPVDGKLVELFVHWPRFGFLHARNEFGVSIKSDRMYSSCTGCLLMPILPTVRQKAPGSGVNH